MQMATKLYSKIRCTARESKESYALANRNTVLGRSHQPASDFVHILQQRPLLDAVCSKLFEMIEAATVRSKVHVLYFYWRWP